MATSFLAFDKRNRNAGIYTSPSVAVVPETTIDVRGDLDPVDREDSALIIKMDVEGSYTTVNPVWVPLLSCVFQGGYLQEDGTYTNPSMGFGPPPQGIQLVRGIIDINQRVSIGVEVIVG